AIEGKPNYLEFPAVQRKREPDAFTPVEGAFELLPAAEDITIGAAADGAAAADLERGGPFRGVHQGRVRVFTLGRATDVHSQEPYTLAVSNRAPLTEDGSAVVECCREQGVPIVGHGHHPFT